MYNIFHGKQQNKNKKKKQKQKQKKNKKKNNLIQDFFVYMELNVS